MTSRGLARVNRRFADQQEAKLADIPSLRGFFATVTSVTGGTFVSWHGNDSLKARAKNAAYTPAVDDRVLCILDGGQLVITGKYA